MPSLYSMPASSRKDEDNKPLCDAMKQQLFAAKEQLLPLTVMWMLNWFYLRGVRRFPVLRWESGQVETRWVRKDGKIPFKYPGIVKNYMAEFGRLLSLDLMPMVSAAYQGLTSHLDRSVSQVALDSMLSKTMVNRAKRHMVNYHLLYGMGGLSPSIHGNPERGYWIDLEAVPAWELTPIPESPYTRSCLLGMNRDRMVGLDWAMRRFGEQKFKNRADTALGVRNMPFGRQFEPADDQGGALPGGRRSRRTRETSTDNDSQKNRDKRSVQWVHLHEQWLYGEGQHLTRYTVRANDIILRDEEYDINDMLVPPISQSFYTDSGGFYGLSWMDLQVSLNRQTEELMSCLFENVKGLSKYGILALPANMGNPRHTIRDTGHDMLVMYYEPSQYAPQARPTRIQPNTSGNLPGQTAAFASQQLDHMAPGSNLDLPARTDSPSAIGMIDKAQQRPIVGSQESLAGQFGSGYKYAIQNSHEFFSQQRPVFLTKIDDNLAGVRIDSRTGQIDLSVTNMPDVSGLEFTVRDEKPRMKESIKSEIMQMVQLQIVSAGDVPLLNYLHNLGMPILETPEFNTAITTMLNNILLFNDGVTPGQVVASSVTDNPLVAMRMLARFMNRPLFKLADVGVRLEFEKLYEFYKMAMTEPRNQMAGRPSPDQIVERGAASAQTNGRMQIAQ